MITNAVPTRAEVSDVAGAIFDGSDAVMCSGETAMGAHPASTVEWMGKIIAEAESHADDVAPSF
jgi:pyruvate kinase